MSVMNGLEMLEHLRNDDQLKHICVIISSASVSQMDQQIALDAGGNDFLPKPINAEDTLNMLGKYLQLTWKYKATELQSTYVISQDDNSDLVVPTVEDLQILFELAQDGLLIKLVEMAEKIGRKSDRYLPFTQKVSQLALAKPRGSYKEFQTEEIETLIKKYLPLSNL